MSRQRKKVKRSEIKRVRLNELVGQQINEVYQKVPQFAVAEGTFMSIVLQNAAVVTINDQINTFGENDDLKELLANEYIRWEGKMYRWLKQFGIFPWRLIAVNGTSHMFPEALPFDAGYIQTYLDKQHTQKFEWVWADVKKVDESVYFTIKRHKPTIRGEYITPVTGLIADFYLLQQARQITTISWYNQVNPHYALEYKPGPDSNRLASVAARVNGIRVGNLSTNARDLNSAIELVNSHNNRPLKRKSLRRGLGNAEKIPKDYTLKILPAGKVDINLKLLSDNLSERAASIMEFREKKSTQKKTVVESENMVRFLNERVKAWSGFFEKQVKTVIEIVYGDMLKKQCHNNYYDIEVAMGCTPFTAMEDLENAYTVHNMISQKDFFKHASQKLGIPQSDILI